jgi:hypothetical protein
MQFHKRTSEAGPRRDHSQVDPLPSSTEIENKTHALDLKILLLERQWCNQLAGGTSMKVLLRAQIF